MSSPTEEEKQVLLPSSHPSTTSSDATTEPTAISTAASSSIDSAPIRPPVIHYSSISVHCLFPKHTTPTTGSLQIIERDLGAANDFWNIHMDFSWKPRGTSKSEQRHFDAFSKGIDLSVDCFLTMRMCLKRKTPAVIFHLQGGKLLGQFLFPNGPDALMAFVRVFRTHVELYELEDAEGEGELFVLEGKQRMRRMAPIIPPATAAEPSAEEDYSGLLEDLSLGEQPKRERRRPRRSGGGDADLGMKILSHFAKVTQVARDVGEDISVFLDEKKRRAEIERREMERAARRRALDIYADIVASTDVERELPPRLTLDDKRGVELCEEVWRDAFDSQGKLMDVAVVRQAIFSGGIEARIRGEVWPFVIGFYPWESTREEREKIRKDKLRDYVELKATWLKLQAAAKEEDDKSVEHDPEAVTMDRRKRVSKPHSKYLETEEQIAKDIVRTDRQLDLYKQDDAPATLFMGILLNVYATYDDRINYCQGMSDFLSPMIHVLGTDDESLVFWCFESLMHRIEGNFRVDQSGMREQLGKLRRLIKVADKDLAAFFEQSDPDFYCCFRWVLVRFKRELPFDGTARLWEVFWTRQVGGDDLHIFVTGALLLAHRRQLLSLPQGAFDSLLRYINDMSMRIDVDFALREGELCYRKYGHRDR